MPEPTVSGDPDLETVFHAEGSSTAEMEALAVRALLDANGIPTVLVGDPVLPNLPFEVKVAGSQAERARQLMAEAQKVGPIAAEAAEKQFECEHSLLLPEACDEGVD
jgi:hypothetical protein